MSDSFYFKLRELPDFSLSKYKAHNSQSDVSEKNLIFIKQLHGLGIVLNMDFHLYYIFNPEPINGSKMTVILECRCVNECDIDIQHLYNIISSYAICEIYQLDYLDNGKTIDSLNYYTGNHSYKYFNSVYKKQLYTAPNYSDNIGEKEKCYYSISDWEIRDEPRFFNTLLLIGRLNHHLILRIDAEVVSNSERIVTDINAKGIYKSIKLKSSMKIGLDNAQIMTRDESAEDVARFYENYIKKMSAELQFKTAICVLSDYSKESMMIIETLISEVIERGLFEYDSFNAQNEGIEGFDISYKLDSPSCYGKDDIFDKQKVWYMRSLYTAEELSAFMAFPYTSEYEKIEIRKETDPELNLLNDKYITIGYVSDIASSNSSSTMPVNFPLDNFCKHGYICGVPGSGKTYTMKHLIHSLNKNKIPFLVFEPAKKEYRGLYNIKPDDKINKYGSFQENEDTKNIILFSLCANSMFPFHINPLEILDGVSVSEYISTLYMVFYGAFSWPSPSANVLKKALDMVYREKELYGNMIIDKQSVSFKNLKFPTMSDLYNCFEKVMQQYSYADDIQNNIKGILESRIGSLIDGYDGELFNIGCSSIAPEDWINKSVIMELESLTTEHANFISLLILSLIRLKLKKAPISSGGLRHVIFFEEAHNLIGPSAIECDNENSNSKIAATIYIKNMLAEVRAYNEGIIIADQLPSALAPEVLKNTSLKIAHRQAALDERKAIASVMSADSIQIERLAQFSKGQGLISFEGEQSIKPFEIQVTPEFRYSGDMVDDAIVLNKIYDAEWYLDSIIESLMGRMAFCCEKLDEIKIKKFNIENEFFAKADNQTQRNANSHYIAGLDMLIIKLNDINDVLYGINNFIKEYKKSLPNADKETFFEDIMVCYLTTRKQTNDLMLSISNLLKSIIN